MLAARCLPLVRTNAKPAARSHLHALQTTSRRAWTSENAVLSSRALIIALAPEALLTRAAAFHSKRAKVGQRRVRYFASTFTILTGFHLANMLLLQENTKKGNTSRVPNALFGEQVIKVVRNPIAR